ncbi:MAG: S8 family serine peptidase [Calditrichaceae bacterium]
MDDFKGWDFAGNKPQSISDNDVKPLSEGIENVLSHGTQCGGVIAAVADNNKGIAGIAFNTKLIFTKHVYDIDSDNPELINTIEGIAYCAEMGADIINCAYTSSYRNPFTQAAINALVRKYDCIIVCPAGNDDWNNDNSSQYPADYANTLSVAALTNTDTKASYSNYGESVDISAPGGEGTNPASAILSTIHHNVDNGYANFQGTSVASSIVAGSFAMLKTFFPNKSGRWLIKQIQKHADNIDVLNPTFEGELGSGRVNVYNAIARNIFPRVVIDTSIIEITNDDGNEELNPGESGLIQLALYNDSLWMDSKNTEVSISSPYSSISFSDIHADFNDILSGTIVTNFNDPLEFTVSEDAALEPIDIIITIKSNKGTKYPYNRSDTIQVQPKLNQTGFPVLKGYNINLPVTCDSLFGTGEKHVIVLPDNDSLYVFNADGSYLSGFPVYVGYTTAVPIVADMNSNGQKEIVVINNSGDLKVLANSGATILKQSLDQQVQGNAAVANMDADLDLEIIFGTINGDLIVMNIDGSIKEGFPNSINSSIEAGVAVGDITGDHIPEIVFGSSDGKLHAINADGDTLSNFPVELNSKINSSPVILKIDSDSTSYHIFTTTQDNNFIRVDMNGKINSLYSSFAFISTGISICDINKDEAPDMVLGTDAGKLYAFTIEGDSLQNYPIQVDGSISAPSVFADFDDDNKPEIVLANNSGILHILHNDGTNYINSPAVFDSGLTGSPCVEDLDGDGDFEVIFGGHNGLNIIDEQGVKSKTQYWNTFRSNNHRTGYYIFKRKPTYIAEPDALPGTNDLLQNYPNPFNPTTTIEYTLSVSGKVVLSVYNILGQHIRALIQEYQTTGVHKTIWDGTDDSGKRVVSGVYFYKLTIEDENGQVNSYIRKMLLVR